MIPERKRFSYLTVQQRALNSSNAVDSEKAALSSKPGSIISSNTKTNKRQQPPVNQVYTSFSRNSSVKKNVQPLAEIQQNSIFSSTRASGTKNPTIADKENISLRQSLKKDEKPYQISSKQSNQSQLQARVKQLEEENSMILKQTEQKFLQMEKHLEKVEGILREKETVIETLSNQNQKLSTGCKSLEGEASELKDQKEELLRIVAEKNEQIKRITTQKQRQAEKQATLLDQLNTYALNSKLQSIQSIQPKTLNIPQTLTSQTQTQLQGTKIDQLLSRSLQAQDKLNYRQKYETLFKKALQMEDEMYKLKEELFDSQNEVKTIQQEFNTYKIFNQIQKISQKV